MRILIINSSESGHHPEYRSFLEKAFTELGHEVYHFTQVNGQINSGSSYTNNSLFQPLSKIKNKILKHWNIRKRALLNLKEISCYIKTLNKDLKKPDLIFFACLDTFTGQNLLKYDINRYLSVPFSGILFQPRDTKKMTRSFFRRGPFDPSQVLKSKKCKNIAVLIEERIPEISGIIAKPVYPLPDIVVISENVTDTELSKLLSEKAKNRFIIGLFGSLELRKGIAEFLELVEKLPKNDFFFIMAGQHKIEKRTDKDKQVFEQGISGNIENLLIFNRWLTDDELYSGMKYCNLIFAAYHNWKYSSGIIGKSAALGVPILVNDGYLMAKRVKEYNLGFIKNESTDILTWISNNLDMMKQIGDTESFKKGCSSYCEKFGYEAWLYSLKKIIAFN